MSAFVSPIPLRAARTLALHSQGLTTPNGAEPTPDLDRIYQVVDQIGAVQIDTLQRVHRSQYLVLWSRLGNYTPADFDRLVYAPVEEPAPQRRLFEYWLHAACILPLREYRYRLPTMHAYREERGHWNTRWLSEDGNRDLVEEVYARLQDEGPLRTKDFAQDGHRSASWWGWKPAKRALEVLYDWGDAMIADRINFQRVYAPRDAVLPDWVDTTPPTEAEMQRYFVARAIQVFGICQPMQAAEYAYLNKRSKLKPHLDALIQDSTLVEVDVELLDGAVTPMVVHRDNLPALQQALDGDLVATRTTFLSPFDNLCWPKDRDRQFWGFRHVLEAYKPAPDRIWGYFCLSILHCDRLVGRFDPKLERKTGTLRLVALYLEPGIQPDDELVADVATAMRDFMAFHHATTLVIERSDPPEFGQKLLAAL